MIRKPSRLQAGSQGRRPGKNSGDILPIKTPSFFNLRGDRMRIVNPIIKYPIILVLSVLFVNGCIDLQNLSHRDRKVPSSELPGWYLNPTNDDVNFWYGLGSGDTPDGAVGHALTDIASRLKISVKAEYHEKASQLNKKYDINVESKIDTTIDEIQFSGYEFVKSEKHGGKYYVLIKVNKEQFLSDRKTSLNKLDAEIERIYSIGKNLNDQEIELLLGKIDKAIDLSMLVNSIRRSPGIERNYGKYVVYENNAKKFKRNKLVGGTKKTLASMDKDIESIYAHIRNKPAVEMLKECEASGLYTKMNEASKLAKAINDMDSAFSDKRFSAKYFRYKNHIDSVRNSVGIFLNYDQNSKYIAANIRELLNDNNIKTIETAGKNNRNTITVEIKSSKNKAIIDGANILRLNTTVIVRGASRSIISSNQFVTSGRSYVGLELAFKNAAEAFSRKAREQGVLTMLGLTWLTNQP
jgi:hypothetical protein